MNLISKILLSALIFFTLSCSNESISELVSLSGSTMGTTYSIKFIKNQDIETVQIKTDIDSTLKKVNQQMSTYIPTSELSQFNSYKDTSWFKISNDLAYVIKKSLDICGLSSGALDITVGPLVNLWGFGPEHRPTKIPSESDIQRALKNVGWENLQVTLNPPSVKKRNPNIYCDLSSTAKGYGVDKIAEYFDSLNISNYLIEIGGELNTKGNKIDKSPWRVGISKPDELGGIQEIINLSNSAMATSGDYWNYFEENGLRYSHTINPVTGKPIMHKLASVTVLAESCLLADGYATAMNVMGEKKAIEFAKKNNLKAYFIYRNNDEFVINYTNDFEKLIDKN
ncbi:MAG: FAD:protein FMN transferase [Bacteroidota bacterium]